MTNPNDILKGNADLEESCVWVPRDVRPGTTPLPAYPAPTDLPEPPVRGDQ